MSSSMSCFMFKVLCTFFNEFVMGLFHHFSVSCLLYILGSQTFPFFPLLEVFFYIIQNFKFSLLKACLGFDRTISQHLVSRSLVNRMSTFSKASSVTVWLFISKSPVCGKGQVIRIKQSAWLCIIQCFYYVNDILVYHIDHLSSHKSRWLTSAKTSTLLRSIPEMYLMSPHSLQTPACTYNSSSKQRTLTPPSPGPDNSTSQSAPLLSRNIKRSCINQCYNCQWLCCWTMCPYFITYKI